MFGNPYKVPTGPTAHSAPAFPLLPGQIYRFLGQGQRAEFAKELLSTAASPLQYALLPLATLCLGCPTRIGALGGLLGALFPFRFWLETKGSLEQVYGALAFLVAIMGTGAAWKSVQPGASFTVGLGAAWALAFHVSASLLPVFLGLCWLSRCRSSGEGISCGTSDTWPC